MIEADRADHSRAKLDHDLIVPITMYNSYSTNDLVGIEDKLKEAYPKFTSLGLSSPSGSSHCCQSDTSPNICPTSTLLSMAVVPNC